MKIITEMERVQKPSFFKQMSIPTTEITLADRFNLANFKYKKILNSKFMRNLNYSIDVCIGALAACGIFGVGLIIYYIMIM